VPLNSESVTLAGSGLVFNNTYSDTVTAPYRAAILSAETFLQSQFTDAVTLNMHFDFAPLNDGLAQNAFFLTSVSYASYVAALQAHAASPDDRLALAGFPASDPTNGLGFTLPTGYARMLGLTSNVVPIDDAVLLNSNAHWTFGQDVIGALEHEITEGGMGRNGGLGITENGWEGLDLFRFAANGQRNFTGGADNVQTFFGVDSTHVTAIEFHSPIYADGYNDGGDLGDWETTVGDAFGPGGPGEAAIMSATDLRVMDVLGWTYAGAPPAAPADDFADILADSTHPLGAVASGGSASGTLQYLGDRDWFRIDMRAGETYTITLAGAGAGAGALSDPVLRLHDAMGAQVAFSDDITHQTNLNSRVSYAADTTGTYYVDVGAYDDNLTGAYRIDVTEAPTPPDDYASRFNDTTHAFGAISDNASVSAALESVGDRDWFKVTLTAGTNYAITMTGVDGGGGTLADPDLTLYDSSGGYITFNEDISYPANDDSRIVFHATVSGTYYIAAGSFLDEGNGTYTVSLAAGAAAPSAGDDVLVGNSGGDTLQASTGNDTVIGANAQNYLRGDEGNDSLSGGSKFDDINGNQGNDTIHGNGGDDYSVGGKGDDLLFGDAGNDIVWGNLGNDTCDGGDGNDQVRGGQGDDSLSGGAGNDFISGDRGNDTESGGAGADNFHGSQEIGIDRVLDFHVAEGDRVQLDPGTTYTVSQVGADTVLDMGNGNQMILVGVSMSSLTASSIFFG
jgi:Ca2+-binding RTX toxin-like protein